uniref:Uncharacterized protein n=1 Tax=Rhizophora mucronata TaxID=61149 RepID=A0A2P2P3U8_RHIMU
MFTDFHHSPKVQKTRKKATRSSKLKRHGSYSKKSFQLIENMA